MLRLLHAIVTGLIGAALLHLVIVLALPRFTGRDAYSRALETGATGVFHVLAKGEKAGPLSPDDPFVETAVCAFSLINEPRAVTASGQAEFWSFAVFDKAANEVFSISDRSVTAGRLDAIVATPAQAARLRKADPDITEKSILIEMEASDGYLVLRSLAPHASMEPQAIGFLTNARCDALRRP